MQNNINTVMITMTLLRTQLNNKNTVRPPPPRFFCETLLLSANTAAIYLQTENNPACFSESTFLQSLISVCASMHAYVCVCVCACVYVCACIVCMHVCMCEHMHVCICAGIHLSMCARVCKHVTRVFDHFCFCCFSVIMVIHSQGLFSYLFFDFILFTHSF